jgi:hypothetical protein
MDARIQALPFDPAALRGGIDAWQAAGDAGRNI